MENGRGEERANSKFEALNSKQNRIKHQITSTRHQKCKHQITSTKHQINIKKEKDKVLQKYFVVLFSLFLFGILCLRFVI